MDLRWSINTHASGLNASTTTRPSSGQSGDIVDSIQVSLRSCSLGEERQRGKRKKSREEHLNSRSRCFCPD